MYSPPGETQRLRSLLLIVSFSLQAFEKCVHPPVFHPLVVQSPVDDVQEPIRKMLLLFLLSS